MDSFSFTALPAGYRNSNKKYEDFGLRAYFWSANPSTNYIALNMGLRYGYDTAYVSNSNFKSEAYSVRCLKDDQVRNGAELSEEILTKT